MIDSYLSYLEESVGSRLSLRWKWKALIKSANTPEAKKAALARYRQELEVERKREALIKNNKKLLRKK